MSNISREEFINNITMQINSILMKNLPDYDSYTGFEKKSFEILIPRMVHGIDKLKEE